MGRRKHVQSVEKDVETRYMGASGRRCSASAHEASGDKSKAISTHVPGDEGGGYLSRKGSLGVRGGDAAQDRRGSQFTRNQRKSGDSFRRLSRQQGGGDPVHHHTSAAVPPLTHQQQQQQRRPHGVALPFAAYPIGDNNDQACGSGGEPRRQHPTGSISPSEPLGSPSRFRHGRQVLLDTGGAGQGPQKPCSPQCCQPPGPYAPHPSHEGSERNRSRATPDAQGLPHPPYCGSFESPLPPPLNPFCHLPQLPYVMTPQGLMAPPPLYLFAEQICPIIPCMPPPQLPCQSSENRNGAVPLQCYAKSGDALTVSPQAPRDYQQRSALDHNPVSSPQPTRVGDAPVLAANGATVSMTLAAAPQAAAVAQTTAAVGTELLRTASIRKHTSSFRKSQGQQQADIPATDPPITLPRTTSILNRVSSFKKAGRPISVSDQALQQEISMQQRLQTREQERVRLQQEMQARLAADKAAREQRLRELQQCRPPRNFAQQSSADPTPRVLEELPKLNEPSGNSTWERGPELPCKSSFPAQLPTRIISPASRPGADVPASSKAPLKPQRSPPAAISQSSAGLFATKGNLLMEAMEDRRTSPVPAMSEFSALRGPVGKDKVRAPDCESPAGIAQDSGPAGDAATSTAADALHTAVSATEQLWHRCTSLVLYEIPLRCTKTVNSDGVEQIDDSKFPLRLYGRTLRVTDVARQTTNEYHLDELVTHRRGSTRVDSKILQEVTEVLVAGYSASVLSLDSKGLSKPVSAFDSAAWLAKQRLLMNVLGAVEKRQSAYSQRAGSGEYFEAHFSFALVKKVSLKRAAEQNRANPATAQQTYEVVDLLPPEPTIVPLKMHSCVLYGDRLAGVQYRTLRNESEFMTALASAQAKANIILGRLADPVAADPDDEVAVNEQASVFQVITCVLLHRKEGAISLQEQMAEPAEAVYQRELECHVISSDDEDDTEARAAFRSHNTPSNHSDIIMNCLTCIGAQQSHDLWIAALERKESMAPAALFGSAFGGPAYTVVLASVDPTTAESAAALETQSAMAIKRHRRPLNGSARRLIQTLKYLMAGTHKTVEDAKCLSGSQQHSLKSGIRKHAAVLDALGQVLESIETRRFSGLDAT
ncbi:hypothetical protein LSCM1_02812 [Leishmania martiniquensis]|uniref:Uncharacterized protein n=1 Tax=Leishmania martiniquensis TaxID=1580590 RepID=A0A836H2C2_9TRYP|nr:hypothetical protein LSCM1_02812 [Leishmania martiniquensis]